MDGTLDRAAATSPTADDDPAGTPETKTSPAESFPDSHSPAFTVILPTYNEAPNIREAVTRILRAIEGLPGELLVVDDDSPDGTADVVRNEFADTDRVRVLVRDTEPSGLSESVVDGFDTANGSIYVVLDADLQHPPEKIPEFIRQCVSSDEQDESADLVLGTRFGGEGGIEDWPPLRKAVSKGAELLASLAVPDARKVSDPMTGFFAVHRDALDDADLNPTGYKIALEVLSEGDVDSISEVPYVFQDRARGESNLTAKEYVRFLRHLLRLRIRRLRRTVRGD